MKNKFVSSLLIALIAGTLTGLLLKENAAPLGDYGMILIQFLKILVTPLLALAILESILKTSIKAKQGMKLLTISSLNAVVAFFIALVVGTLYKAGEQCRELVGTSNVEKLDALLHDAPHKFSEVFQAKNLVPKSFVEPFLQNQIMSIIFLMILVGFALRALKEEGKESAAINTLESIISTLFQSLAKVLAWVTKLIPLSVFCVMAKSVGLQGLVIFKTMGIFLLLISIGLFIHTFIYYAFLLKALTKVSPLAFFKNASEAILMSFSTSSSLAALPTTLKVLEQKLKVSHSNARLAACVGTNLNHDGILLYEAATALFVAQMYGIDLSFHQTVILGFTSVLAAVGIAGIPDAGLITLSLVLSAVGLPLEAVPLLIPVDWLLSRMRAATNTTSDMVVAQILDQWKR